MNKNSAAEIRFFGFNYDWEQRKLGDMVDILKAYSLTRDFETSEETGYKYIHYGDIHTKVADVIEKDTVLPNIKPSDYEELETGDIIVADASEDYKGIADAAVIVEKPPFKIVAGLHTIAIRPKNIDALFLYYQLHTDLFKHHGYKVGTGMKVFGISYSNLSLFEAYYPNKDEQKKISSFIRKIDKIIELHQCELDRVKELKKGFLQKMFPKEGETVPEIRFVGATDEWGQRKIGELGEIVTGSTPPTEDKSNYNGNYLFVSPADIQNNRYVENTITTLSEKGFHKGRILKEG